MKITRNNDRMGHGSASDTAAEECAAEAVLSSLFSFPKLTFQQWNPPSFFPNFIHGRPALSSGKRSILARCSQARNLWDVNVTISTVEPPGKTHHFNEI